MFKKDLKHAYRQIPMDPHDYHLLGMIIDGLLYFHTSMPFGLCSATLACQRTTKAIAYILSPSWFSSHSFLRGGATFVFQQHAPPAFIKAQGDWKSDAYLVDLTLSADDKLQILNSITPSRLSPLHNSSPFFPFGFGVSRLLRF